MLEDEQEAVLRNPFPSPPSHYQKYTSHNLNLLALLKSRSQQESLKPNGLTNDEEKEVTDGAAKFKPLTTTAEQQREILHDQEDVPDWPLSQLEKPRVDWILEEGYYNVYGDAWFVRVPLCSQNLAITEGLTLRYLTGLREDTLIG